MEEACSSAGSFIYGFILKSTGFILKSTGFSRDSSLKTDGVIWPERLLHPRAHGGSAGHPKVSAGTGGTAASAAQTEHKIAAASQHASPVQSDCRIAGASSKCRKQWTRKEPSFMSCTQL